MDAIEFRQQDNALLPIWIRAANDSYAALGYAEIIGQVRHAGGNVDKISRLMAAALWVSVTDLPPSPRVSLRPSHSKGLFYQVGGDREPVGFSNRLLQRTRVYPIGGVA